VCMFRFKFPTKRIFRIFPILRTDGMAPFGTYLWNDPRIRFLRQCEYSQEFPRQWSLNDSGVIENGDAQTFPSKFPTLKANIITQ